MRNAALAVFASVSASMAAAGDNIRILPDQAALACQARAEHELTRRGGEVMAVKRYDTEAMENFMFRVKGLFIGRLNGEEEEVEVECEVSSSKGVEVFTMLVGMTE
ncbi:MAG: hypothetical protein AAF360_08330 [Pseudomonadota bacterium]